MSKMNKLTYSGAAICAGLSCVGMPAYALDGPAPVEFDGGPLGQLDFAAAVDGYVFAQSGTSSDPHTSIVGDQATGAKVTAWMTEVHKATGWLQFTVQAAEYQNINLGTNKPNEVNPDRFQTGPIRSAFATLAPTDNLKLSVGQLPSLEGYETVFAWNNPVGVRTVIAEPENTNSKGIQLDYTQGQYSGTLLFSDGYDTGDYNYLQFSGTDKINQNNNFTIFGGVSMGTTGPNVFNYGSGGLPTDAANGVGAQGLLAEVNSDMLGGWYTWIDGPLSLTGEVQGQYTPALTQYAAYTSGGVSDDIPKATGNIAAAMFGDYKFGDSPYSLAAWVEYGMSRGSAPQDAWFTTPNSSLVGFAVAPTWQYKKVFTRLNIGYVHFLNSGTPPAGFGNDGKGQDQVVGTLEFGLVF